MVLLLTAMHIINEKKCFQFKHILCIMEEQMKRKNNLIGLILILAGLVLGGFIGNLFSSTWLNYGQTFGLTSPFVLDLGILSLTFALTIKITIASIIGIVIGLVIYRLV